MEESEGGKSFNEGKEKGSEACRLVALQVEALVLGLAGFRVGGDCKMIGCPELLEQRPILLQLETGQVGRKKRFYRKSNALR